MTTARKLPSSVSSYAKSPIFSSDSVPANFLEEHDLASGSLTTIPQKLTSVHDLKEGTWGLLNVFEGTVTYFLVGNDKAFETINANDTFTILPQERHFIKVSEDAVFQIEFYR